MRSRGCPPPRHRGDAATSQVLERYKAKVRAHLAQQKAPDTKPPKPPKRVHKVLTSAERKKLRRAYPSSHAPKWHPLCEPKHPRGVLYNRIPKSGSASIMSWMSGQLNETVLRCVEINQCVGCTTPFLGNDAAVLAPSSGDALRREILITTQAKHKFHLPQTDVTWWTPHIAKHRWLDAPDLKKYLSAIATYGQQSRFVTQRHVYYPEGVENTHADGVALVNLIRDPIDRCISRYNYEAFYKKRIPAVDFDACLDGGRCDFRHWDPRTEKHRYQDFPVPKRKEGATDTEWDIFQRLSYNESMRLLADECHDYTVRWFCGHGPECRDPSKPELALEIAKRNVRERYAHVGILTDLENTAQLFRLLLPDFFEGDPSRDLCGTQTSGAPRHRRDCNLTHWLIYAQVAIPTRRTFPRSINRYPKIASRGENRSRLHYHRTTWSCSTTSIGETWSSTTTFWNYITDACASVCGRTATRLARTTGKPATCRPGRRTTWTRYSAREFKFS